MTEFRTAAARSSNTAPVLPSSVEAIELPEDTRPGRNVGSALQATDDNGDQITWSIVAIFPFTGASEFVIDQKTGQIKVAANAVLDFEFAPAGLHDVTVTAADGFGGSASVGVTINLTDVPEPPVAEDDNQGLVEDTTATITVLSNDPYFEFEKELLTLSVVRQPMRGTVEVIPAHPADPNPRAVITYTPQANYHGTDSFTYRVSDPGGLRSNVATVALTVIPVNDAPEFPAATAERGVPQVARPGDPVGAPVTATDIDGDRISYTLIVSKSSSAFGKFEIHGPTGQINVSDNAVLDAVSEPTHVVTVEAADPSGDRSTIDVTITVTGGPRRAALHWRRRRWWRRWRRRWWRWRPVAVVAVPPVEVAAVAAVVAVVAAVRLPRRSPPTRSSSGT